MTVVSEQSNDLSCILGIVDTRMFAFAKAASAVDAENLSIQVFNKCSMIEYT